ncbi:response regulator [Achromobacter aloeverae]|uniref:Response regulator n=1 Tax=Achromobacter aloeverae TaxID=1750518 RepID=A0A4Q1HKI4_9BURK|nr:response regulator [Achromobacter aloeverae]RXN87795.1 response regulator [Achromobacter aloeverae]
MSAEGLQILIVDDNDMASELLSEFVGLLGHDAKTAATGAEALTLCENGRLDVILTDIMLPDCDGYELAARMRKQLGNGVHIIALSGLPKNSQRPEAVAFDHWLEKPVDLSTLEELLARVERKSA